MLSHCELPSVAPSTQPKAAAAKPPPEKAAAKKVVVKSQVMASKPVVSEATRQERQLQCLRRNIAEMNVQKGMLEAHMDRE